MFHRTTHTAAASLLAASAFFASAAAPAQQPDAPASTATTTAQLDLRPRFIAGDENRFIVDMLSRTSTQFLDTPRVRIQEYEQRIRVKRRVVEVSEGGATLEIIFEGVAVTFVAGNKVAKYDTDNANDPAADAVIGPTATNAINKPYTIKVDPLGKVLSVSGNEIDGTKLAAINLIGEDVLVRALGPIYGTGNPEPTAAIGRPWSTTRASAPSKTGSFVFTTEYRPIEVSGDRATIQGSGTIELKPSDLSVEAKAVMESHIVAAEQIWNLDRGIIDRAVHRQEMKITADVEAARPLETELKKRRREIETVLFVNIERVDDGVAPLPVLPASLRPTAPSAPARFDEPAPAAPATLPASND